MSKKLKNLKVAIISDHCFTFAGAMKVTKDIGDLFSHPDYYFLFGDMKYAKKYLGTRRVFFTKLSKLPFLKKYYRYTYFLWPLFIESLNLSKYDLVISSSFSVSHGVISSTNGKHIAYVHTPMRYAWDLTFEYFNSKRVSFLKRLVIPFFLNYLRVWDSCASVRSDVLIANSNFIKKRIQKYWRRDVDTVIPPPVDLYDGEINRNRGNYFVAGAPFEVNKGGDFILECAKVLGFELRIIGVGDDYSRLRNRYSKVDNIYFLGKVSERDKWELLSNAKGFICAGTEDFGMFTVEAISCGTPVIAYKGGGYLDTVREGENGMFFVCNTVECFEDTKRNFEEKNWDYEYVASTVVGFSKERFIQEFMTLVLKNIK